MAERLRRGLLAVLSGAALVIMTGGVEIREDEFACEEAVAHLLECCPNFPRTALQCTYDAGCGMTQYTDLETGQARCLRDRSCTQLRTSGACDQRQWQPRSTCTVYSNSGDVGEGGGGTSQPGCVTAVPVCR